MDNGDDRIFASGVTCGATGAPPCLYSTIPVFQIDENAKTATLIFHQILPANLYSIFSVAASIRSQTVTWSMIFAADVGSRFLRL